jgi:hypothetical protein
MKWEYKVQTLLHDHYINDVLNEMGYAGWELVTTHLHGNRHIVVYMKRPKVNYNHGK